MNLIHWLADFSRGNCIGICSALVPSILLGTTFCGGLAYFRQARWLINTAFAFTLMACGMMLLHVASWFSIGVVTPVTFILLGLSLTFGGLSTLIWFFSPHWQNSPDYGLKGLLKANWPLPLKM